MSGAKISLSHLQGLATQTAAHNCTVLVPCGECKYPMYPMSGYPPFIQSRCKRGSQQMTLVISYLPFECLLPGSPLAIFWSSGKESGFYTEWGWWRGGSLLSHLASGHWANLGTSPNNRTGPQRRAKYPGRAQFSAEVV